MQKMKDGMTDLASKAASAAQGTCLALCAPCISGVRAVPPVFFAILVAAHLYFSRFSHFAHLYFSRCASSRVPFAISQFRKKERKNAGRGLALCSAWTIYALQTYALQTAMQKSARPPPGRATHGDRRQGNTTATGQHRRAGQQKANSAALANEERAGVRHKAKTSPEKIAKKTTKTHELFSGPICPGEKWQSEKERKNRERKKP